MRRNGEEELAQHIKDKLEQAKKRVFLEISIIPKAATNLDGAPAVEALFMAKKASHIMSEEIFWRLEENLRSSGKYISKYSLFPEEVQDFIDQKVTPLLENQRPRLVEEVGELMRIIDNGELTGVKSGWYRELARENYACLSEYIEQNERVLINKAEAFCLTGNKITEESAKEIKDQIFKMKSFFHLVKVLLRENAKKLNKDKVLDIKKHLEYKFCDISLHTNRMIMDVCTLGKSIQYEEFLPGEGMINHFLQKRRASPLLLLSPVLLFALQRDSAFYAMTGTQANQKAILYSASFICVTVICTDFYFFREQAMYNKAKDIMKKFEMEEKTRESNYEIV